MDKQPAARRLKTTGFRFIILISTSGAQITSTHKKLHCKPLKKSAGGVF
jgi:hypothetical protein